MTPERAAGAMVGCAVGDALGMPLEGWSVKRIERQVGSVRRMMPGRLPAGSYTDDAQMTLALAESLLACGGVREEHLMGCFLRRFEPRRGYGPGTRRVLWLWRQGAPWQEAARAAFPEGSYGNGAAMRVAPVGIAFRRDPLRLREEARRASLLTHAHPWGWQGAVLQAMAVATALCWPGQLDPQAFLERLEPFAEGPYQEALREVAQLLRGEVSPQEVIHRLGNGVEAHRSVPTAIYCVLRHFQDFEEAVSFAVGLGGDADTIGAMTGAISGALHGLGAIPQHWREVLEDQELFVQLGQRLWELVESSS